jgi:hypothetical protein
LYSNHRDKPSTWFYIISNFSKIKQEGIRRNILGLLSNYASNPTIFWHKGNLQYYPSEKIQERISSLMTSYFRRNEIELVLPYMQEGINQGSFSFLVFLVNNFVKDVHLILKDIAFNVEFDDEQRNLCIWLYMQIAKFQSIEETLKTIDAYLSKFSFGYEDENLLGVRESIRKGELWPVGL